MRKYFFSIMAITFILVLAGSNVCVLKNNDKLSDLALNNVEALAFDPEWGSTSSPCSPCMPRSCTWTKRIGAQQYLVTEKYMEVRD